jgi:hypothetical protein
MLEIRQRMIAAGQRPDIRDDDLPPAPFIEPAFHWIWRAWHRLHPDRPYYGGGMGPMVPGAIPWGLVRTWAEHHHLTRGEYLMLDRVVQAMDSEYLTWWAERNANDAAAARRSPR